MMKKRCKVGATLAVAQRGTDRQKRAGATPAPTGCPNNVRALFFLALLLSSQSFAQFTLTKNADNYKARKSTFQRWDGAVTVQGQDTVYSTYRNCVNQGWHSVYIWATNADDSVDLMVQYQTVPDTVSPFPAKTLWNNIAALTDTLWIYPYPLYPVTSEHIRFRAYGGVGNDVSIGASFNLYDYGWNIE